MLAILGLAATTLACTASQGCVSTTHSRASFFYLSRPRTLLTSRSAGIMRKPARTNIRAARASLATLAIVHATRPPTRQISATVSTAMVLTAVILRHTGAEAAPRPDVSQGAFGRRRMATIECGRVVDAPDRPRIVCSDRWQRGLYRKIF